MKICRFCNHEQESGNYCDACGSPLSADKVDFSDSSSDSLGAFGEFPDPTKSAFPDPTDAFPDPTQAFPNPTQAFPDPTSSSSTKSPDYSSIQSTQPASEHVAGTAVAAFGTKDTPEKPMTSPEELMSKGAVPTAQEKDNSQPKVMYSAAAKGETVYAKSKGGLGSGADFTPVQPGPGWWNGAPNSGANTPQTSQSANKPAAGQNTASASSAAQNTTSQNTATQNTAASQTQEALPVFSVAPQGPGVGTNPEFPKYEKLYTHTLTTFGISLVGLFCCCGMTMISLILSALAYAKMSALKKGTTMQSAEEIVPKVKTYILISDILLGVSFLVMAIVVITNAASSG